MSMTLRLTHNTILGACAASVFTLLASGCGIGGGSSTGSTPVTAATVPGGIGGMVHGGQQPVTGSSVQLYEIGATGYNGIAKPILASPVTTGAGGSFSITGLYSCDAGSYVYLTASGGNPGFSANNPQIALVAALGSCSALKANAASTFVVVNEVTTVAAAYALAQFSGNTSYGTPLLSQPGSAGANAPADNFTTSSTNLQGVANAIALAQVMANNATGTSPGINANGTATPEYWQINTLADILAACVNSAGLADSSNTSCSTLFSNVAIPSGTNPATGAAYVAPADTLQAALYMALNPVLTSTQIGKLYGVITASGTPFQPYAAAAANVNDLSIAVAYNPVVPGSSTALLSRPSSATLDAYGNVWLTNQPATSGSQNVVEIDPTGNPIVAGAAPTGAATAANYVINTYGVNGTSEGFLGYGAGTNPPAFSPAIDLNNNFWIGDRSNDAVMVVQGSGPVYTAAGAVTTTNGGNYGDSGGKGAIGYGDPVWCANCASTRPSAIAVDGNNNVYVANAAGSTTNGGSASTCTLGVANSAVAYYTTNLVTFVNGSASNVNYGKWTGAPYGIAIGPATLDTVSGAAIPGSPFIWGMGYTSGGNAASSSLPNTYAGILYQGYTGTAGIPTGGATVSGQGCPTPLTLTTTASGASYSSAGISSILDSSALTQVPGTLGSNATNTTQTSVSPTIAGSGDAGAFMMSAPYDMTVDQAGNVWVANTATADSTSSAATGGTLGVSVKSSLSKIVPNYGSAFTPASAAASFDYTLFHDIAGLSGSTVSPRFLAPDGGGTMWFSMSTATSTVGAISASGAALTPPYNSTGSSPFNTQSGLEGSTPCSTCYFTGTTTVFTRNNGPAHIAVDASGNLWLPMNYTKVYPQVLEIVGAAVPVATPTSVARKNGLYAQKP